VSQAAQVFMGTQERKEQGNEESMMWTHFVAVQWQITFSQADNIGHMADNTFWFRWIHGTL
jgi:hypothetical protein